MASHLVSGYMGFVIFSTSNCKAVTRTSSCRRKPAILCTHWLHSLSDSHVSNVVACLVVTEPGVVSCPHALGDIHTTAVVAPTAIGS